MKKLTLILAVLATVTISLVSFTKSKASVEAEDQTGYVWIRYGCQPYGASSPLPGAPYYSTQSPDMLQGNCPDPGSSGVCAVRFLRSEVTCYEDIATPNPGVNPWDGNHMIKYCPN